MSTSERVFHTPLQMDQCQERLLHSLHERGTWVGGTVEGNRFCLWERGSIGNSTLMPELHGVLQSNIHGTHIHVRFEQERTVYKFIGAMGILFLLIGVWIAFTDLIGTSTLFRDNIEYVPRFTAILIFAILGNLVIARMTAESSKKNLLDQVRQLLIAVEQT